MKFKFSLLCCVLLFLVGSQVQAQCQGGSCRSSQSQSTVSFGTCTSGNCSASSQSSGHFQSGYYIAPSAPVVTYRFVDAPVAQFTAPTAQKVTTCPNGTCATCDCPNGVCQSGSCPASAAKGSPKVEWKFLPYSTDEAALLIDGVQVGNIKTVVAQEGSRKQTRTDWQPLEGGKWGERVTVASKVEFVGHVEPIPVAPMPIDLHKKH